MTTALIVALWCLGIIAVLVFFAGCGRHSDE